MPEAAPRSLTETGSDDDAGWLMLHGTPLVGRIWSEVASRLGTRHTSFPDLSPQSPSGSLQARCAQGLAQALIASGRKVDLVGHSLGGQVAVELTLAAPLQVRSLLILCSRDTAFPAFAATAKAVRSAAQLDIDSTLARWFRPDELAADGSAVRLARSCLFAADRQAYAAALDAIASWQSATQRQRLRIPITLIAAEHDPVSSPTVMREWADGLENARFILLPGAAHMSVFTRPEELARLLLQHRAWVQSASNGAE